MPRTYFLRISALKRHQNSPDHLAGLRLNISSAGQLPGTALSGRAEPSQPLPLHLTVGSGSPPIESRVTFHRVYPVTGNGNEWNRTQMVSIEAVYQEIMLLRRANLIQAAFGLMRHHKLEHRRFTPEVYLLPAYNLPLHWRVDDVWPSSYGGPQMPSRLKLTLEAELPPEDLRAWGVQLNHAARRFRSGTYAPILIIQDMNLL